jgi:hypothetical protein
MRGLTCTRWTTWRQAAKWQGCVEPQHSKFHVKLVDGLPTDYTAQHGKGDADFVFVRNISRYDKVSLGYKHFWAANMKMLLSILVVSAIAGAVWAADGSAPVSTNTHPELVSHGLLYVEPSPDQQRNLDAAAAGARLLRKSEKVCVTVEDARAIIWQSVSIATGSKHICAEYRGFFWFSRLDWAGQDDRTFKSGIAVKKGTGEIYAWEEHQVQPSSGTNAVSPRRSP